METRSMRLTTRPTCVVNLEPMRSCVVTLASHEIHCNTSVQFGTGIVHSKFTAILTLNIYPSSIFFLFLPFEGW